MTAVHKLAVALYHIYGAMIVAVNNGNAVYDIDSHQRIREIAYDHDAGLRIITWEQE